MSNKFTIALLRMLSICGVCVLAGGCQSGGWSGSSSAIRAKADDVKMIRTELYFGTSIRGGAEVSEMAFNDFAATVITPRFPDGLTIIDARGQWRNDQGHLEHEKCKIVIVFHPAEAKLAGAIEEIRAAYKSRFGQESVMRVTQEADVAF